MAIEVSPARFLLLLSVLLLTSVSAYGKEAFVDPDTGFIFPTEIAGFTFENKRRYHDPRLGYGLNYWYSDEIFITVIVYDLGISNIQDGTDGPHVRQQLKQAISDVDRAVESGAYLSASMIEGQKNFPQEFLNASYKVVYQNGTPKRSHIFLRGQKQRFIKVRATGVDDRKIDSITAAFLEHLISVIGSKNK